MLIWVLGFSLANAADSLNWRTSENRVDAEIGAWSLQQLLEALTTATGWQVYVEPDTERTVSAKFKNLAAGEALRLLLGDLSFALLPQDDRPAKLFVFRTNLQDATRLVQPRRIARRTEGARAIGNEWIVTLKPGANETVEQLAKRLGAKVGGGIDKLRAYRLVFEDDAAAQASRHLLELSPDVAGIEQNYRVNPPERVEPLTLSSALPFSLKPAAGADGGNIIVGLIDSATQPVGGSMDEFVLPALFVAGKADVAKGSPTHGTSMMETILRGLALSQAGTDSSPVRILPVDIYGANANTTTFHVAYGISEAVEAGARIINLSLGSDGSSSLLQTLIQNARSQGVIFFAAAGNEPTTAATYPAAYDSVVAVTAGDKRGNVASYANYGSFVDVVGPGASIVNYNNRSYLVTGTSAATAFVSGMAAGIAVTTGRTMPQVESRIRSTLTFKPAGN
jgi:hypothetical protein